MPDPDSLARGVLIGLTAAVPVGPMAILCIRKTLTTGFRAGITFGVGILPPAQLTPRSPPPV